MLDETPQSFAARRCRRPMLASLAALIGLATTGCASMVQSVGMTLLYRKADHPASHTRLDVPYVEPAVDRDKQSLDLFWPEEGTDWPTVVFVHGGGWSFGDRAHSVAGADVYRNIGRFFASRGVGAAVISYRLQPGVDYPAQERDVAAALAFARSEMQTLGGDPDAMFLAGHSAGAWLAARGGIDPETGQDDGVCGLILVSGAAYDLEDEETWRLGASRPWFEERFDDGAPDWARRASVVQRVRSSSPPALVLYAHGEPKKLKRQSEVLVAAYDRADARVTRVVVPGEDHERIVLTLSRDDKTAGPAMLRFIEGRGCAGSTAAG